MRADVQELLCQYATKGILVDTNIMLLFFVGTLNRERIAKFKRTQQFTPRDYDLLISTLLGFQTIVTTPNIVTEVSSLINQLGEPERSGCYRIFAERVASLEEVFLPSRDIASLEWPFVKYGLTDYGIAKISQNKYLVLTDDLRFTYYLNSQGIDTVNFNNLRSDNISL